jgi:CRP-like cAMP-binding protein
MQQQASQHSTQPKASPPLPFPGHTGRIHPEKTPLFHQGDSSDCFYKVNSGVVMTYRLLQDSQRQITGFCTAGDFFGMSSNGVHHDTAVTVATSNIRCVTHADLQVDPELAKELFNRTCSQLEEAQDMMMTLTKKSAAEKVAAFLLMLANRQQCLDEETDIRLPMSRLDIADFLGMSIETVSRRLTDLKSKGVISLPNRHTAHIYHMGELEHMAGAQI